MSPAALYLALQHCYYLDVTVRTRSSWWARLWSVCRARARAAETLARQTWTCRRSWDLHTPGVTTSLQMSTWYMCAAHRYRPRGSTAWPGPGRTPAPRTASGTSSSHPPSDCPSFRKILRNHLMEFTSSSSNFWPAMASTMKRFILRRYR